MSDPVDGPGGDEGRESDAEAGPARDSESGPDAETGPDAADPAGSEPAADADDGSEWQFTLQDLDDREAEAEAAAAAERRRKEPLEAGDPSVENTLFVLLGVVFALFVISRLFLV